MIGSGWLRGSQTLVLGPPGAGKTLVGLQFLREGLAQREPVLLVGFQESPGQLRQVAESLAWSGAESPGSPGFTVLYYWPVELQIDTIVGEIMGRVRREGIRRIVVDAVGDLRRSAQGPPRFVDYMYAFCQQLRALGTTSLLLQGSEREQQIMSIADNLLSLELGSGRRRHRTIRVLKTRGSAHVEAPRDLEIGPQGVRVLEHA
jgi:circadian clock protein KaiC